MPFAHQPQPSSLAALTDVVYRPYWLEDPRCPPPAEPLAADTTADLAIVGAGFTGLWTALLAKAAHPGREVILVEGGTVASGASGRNGGFVAASLTHGFDNGLQRWPGELKLLTELGYHNLAAIADWVQQQGLDCDLIPSGELTVATEPYQVARLREMPERGAAYGEIWHWLTAEEVRRQVNSPTYRGALFNPRGYLVNPAQLAWGLRQACRQAGVRLYEQTPVLRLEPERAAIQLITAGGRVRARQVALATNAYPPLLGRLGHFIVPVYDYVLMTEPLSTGQRDQIGWQGRAGVGDAGNQFHYYRTTVDGRILWGGYDAVYYPHNGFGSRYENNREVYGRLAEHFFETFPQLRGLRFTHAWGGAIDTCSRFSAFWGTTHQGRTAYAAGFTGLGVGASRFAALILLDLLDGRRTERTALQMARSHPVPFPPEPFRSLVIRLTQSAIQAADQHEGRRNAWLQLLDRLGLGFDS